MDKDLEARVDAYVEEQWENVVADITELVSHPSVVDMGAAQPGAPFGPGVRTALDSALGIARRLGYRTDEDEGYLGWAEIPGEEARQVATIAHVDVVPAGSGWKADPFVVRRQDGYLLGRGTADDKGPAVLSLYAGAFLLHEGIKPRYTFRAFLGCDEEVGMTDVHHYLEHHEGPAFLFTPDASFPLGIGEKGLFDGAFVSGAIENGRILSWRAAEATNAIPGESTMELAVDAADLPAPSHDADRLAFEAVEPGVSRITATGKGGHASTPEGTINASSIVVAYLNEHPELLAEDERPFMELLGKVYADTAGEAMGIACSDELFGPLTCIASVVEVRDGRIRQSIDSRVPTGPSSEDLERALSSLAAAYGATFEVGLTKVPFKVEPDDPAVQALLSTYREVSGHASAEPFAMGGGTYARNFARAVSFGPAEPLEELPDWVGSEHGAEEGVCEASMRRALKIYIISLLRLMEFDL